MIHCALYDCFTVKDGNGKDQLSHHLYQFLINLCYAHDKEGKEGVE